MSSTPCKFKNKCNRKDCPYSHELPPRPSGVNPTLCRYGDECQKKNCTFAHLKSPRETTATRPDCRNDVNCIRVDCFFNHPNGRLINRHTEEQQFAAPKQLSCNGRPCAKCEKCCDWYYTGDSKSWKWIQDYNSGKVNDWERFYRGGLREAFKCRADSKCRCTNFFDHDTDLDSYCNFRSTNCFCADNVGN